MLSKKQVPIIWLCMLIIMLSACAKTGLELDDSDAHFAGSDITERMAAYTAFLNGESKVFIDDIGETVDVKTLLGSDSEYQYFLMDMTQDGLPELLLRKEEYTPVYIFTGTEAGLSLLWYDLYWAGYSDINQDGSIFHMREGAAPPHTTYHHLVLDSSGETQEHIVYEAYDSDYDGDYEYYRFDLQEDVAHDEWVALAKPYLTKARIAWKRYTDTVILTEWTPVD